MFLPVPQSAYNHDILRTVDRKAFLETRVQENAKYLKSRTF